MGLSSLIIYFLLLFLFGIIWLSNVILSDRLIFNELWLWNLSVKWFKFMRFSDFGYRWQWGGYLCFKWGYNMWQLSLYLVSNCIIFTNN